MLNLLLKANTWIRERPSVRQLRCPWPFDLSKLYRTGTGNEASVYPISGFVTVWFITLLYCKQSQVPGIYADPTDRLALLCGQPRPCKDGVPVIAYAVSVTRGGDRGL